MVDDEWFEDPTRLLRAELLVDDTARQAITAAAELIWDDLLDAVETDTVTDALLIGLLPRQFRDRAVGDWRRWLATFTTVVWKLGQPAPPPPATMAEQLCVGALTAYTQTGVVDLARDGMVDLDVPDSGIDLELWVEEYLADVDHELLYDPALDGIDDDTTDHQYGFGRMDYEGMFASSTIPVFTVLRPVLVHHLEAYTDGRDAARVFTNTAGSKINLSNFHRDIWDAARTATFPTDSPLRHVRRHDLRHAAITAWLNAGVPLKTCQAWSGHATVSVLLDTYLGATRGDNQLGQQRVDAALNDLLDHDDHDDHDDQNRGD